MNLTASDAKTLYDLAAERRTGEKSKTWGGIKLWLARRADPAALPWYKRIIMLGAWHLSNDQIRELYRLVDQALPEYPDLSGLHTQIKRDLMRRRARVIEDDTQPYITESDPDDMTGLGELRSWAIQFQAAVIAMFLTAVAALVAVFLFTYPGGFPGWVGQLLAGICLSSGYCDFNGLLAAFTVANLILTIFTVFFVWAVAVALGGRRVNTSSDDITRELIETNRSLYTVIDRLIDIQTELTATQPEE